MGLITLKSEWYYLLLSCDAVVHSLVLTVINTLIYVAKETFTSGRAMIDIDVILLTLARSH